MIVATEVSAFAGLDFSGLVGKLAGSTVGGSAEAEGLTRLATGRVEAVVFEDVFAGGRAGAGGSGTDDLLGGLSGESTGVVVGAEGFDLGGFTESEAARGGIRSTDLSLGGGGVKSSSRLALGRSSAVGAIVAGFGRVRDEGFLRVGGSDEDGADFLVCGVSR